MVEVLYKYMTAERVLTCLPEVGDGTLRATQPAALKDPFECAVTAMFIEFGWDELRLNQEFAEVLSSIHGTTPVSEEEVAQAKEEHGIFTFGICLQCSCPRSTELCPLPKALTGC